MDKKQIINDGYEKIDFIFIGVRVSEKITAEALFNKYEQDFTVMKLDVAFLEAIMDRMVADGLMLKNIQKEYIINPLNPELLSIKNTYLLGEKKKRRGRIVDFIFKVLPIFTSITFGVITAIIAVSNLNLTRSKSGNQIKKILIKLDTTSAIKLRQKELLDTFIIYQK